MRAVFMGTPQLAATVLSALADAHEVAGVFTRPDAVRGRGGKLVPSPVKEEALRRGLPVHTPSSLRGDEAAQLVASLRPDVICVAAYGAILPASILGIPRHGCLNVHASLLPRWRGAAPIERAILAGDERTGVCIMRMEEGLDTGPYCLREAVDVDGMNAGELSGRLARLGGECLVRALAQVQDGTVSWTAQPAEGVTYAEKVQKGELDCDPADSVADIDAKVRASGESHPSRLEIAGRPVTVQRVAPPPDAADVAGLLPGQAAVVAKRLVLRAADGAFELAQVKPAGKNSMEGRAFAAGLQVPKGACVNWGRA